MVDASEDGGEFRIVFEVLDVLVGVHGVEMIIIDIEQKILVEALFSAVFDGIGADIALDFPNFDDFLFVFHIALFPIFSSYKIKGPFNVTAMTISSVKKFKISLLH